MPETNWQSREFDVEQPGGWRLMSTEPRRIIAALAFCQGISTFDLERLTPKDSAEFYAHVEKLSGRRLAGADA